MANFQLIKTIAKQKGITLAELSDAVGITPAGLSLIIKSNSTNTTTIEKIAQVLNVRVGVFFDPESEKESAVADTNSLIAQKDEIIAQKDKIIEQKDKIIEILASKR